MNPVGIMQGRLSPQGDGPIQSFPVTTWRDELSLAQQAGLDRIEWIYEVGTEADNPLRTADGLAEIRRLVAETGVEVKSVCADYYMGERLVGQDGRPRESAVRHLIWLLGRVALLEVEHVVLPFVDASSLQTAEEIDGLVDVLATVASIAEGAGVELHLETDLEAPDLEAILRHRVESSIVRVNFDIGNEASAGHDPEEDLKILGPWLGSVHIKDRVLGGSTVALGTGSADFESCFRMFETGHYAGSFILQVARGEDGNELALAKHNRELVSRHVAAARQRQRGSAIGERTP